MIGNFFTLLSFINDALDALAEVGNVIIGGAGDVIEGVFKISKDWLYELITWIVDILGVVIGVFLTESVGLAAGLIYTVFDFLANYLFHNYPTKEEPFSKFIIDSIIENINEAFKSITCDEAINKLNLRPDNYFEIPDKVSVIVGCYKDEKDVIHYIREDRIPDHVDTPFDVVQDIVTQVIAPSAMVVFSLIIMIELFQITTRTEGMRNSGFEAPFKLMVKVAICKIFLDRSQDVLNAIINFSHEMFLELYNLMMSRTYNFQLLSSGDRDYLSNMHYLSLIAWWLSVWLLCGCIRIIINFILPFIVLARMLEIYMMAALAPLPFATFANQEFSQVGKNFIKQFVGIALKSFVIYLIIIIYSSVFSCLMLQSDGFFEAVNAFSEFNLASVSVLGLWGPLFIFIGQVCIKPLIFSFMLLGTIFGADRYTKLITGAFY